MLATTTPEARIGFFLLDGSYFGDFNKDQDFMRASIATPNYGFAAMWAQPWNLSSMSLGEHLGTVFRRTVDTFDRKRENAIMGDPTLRFYQIVPPPSNVTLANGSLTWTALANTTYFIAGAITTLGPYTELGTTMTGSWPATQWSSYRVRAAQKITTASSGTYWEISQGVIKP